MRYRFSLFAVVFLASMVGFHPAEAKNSNSLVTEKQTPAALFQRLSKNARNHWRLVQKIPLHFDTYHPQGMVKIGNEFYLSSVEVTEKPMKLLFSSPDGDRTPGKGKGHLVHFDKRGRLIRQIVLGEGDLYHPGGIDTDGKWIWVPVAEYRPNSKSIIYKVDLAVFQAVESFRVQDHIGGITFNPRDQNLHGISWDAHTFYTWKTEGQEVRHDLQIGDISTYQDCHYAGDDTMICGGLSKSHDSNGSLALIDLSDDHLIFRIDPPKEGAKDIVLTRNAMTFEVLEDRLRFYFLPEDNVSMVYVFDLE